MKKRVLSALLALCLTLSLAGAAFAENETPVTTASPAPVTQNLDENNGEPAELNENGEDQENTELTDETLDNATDGAEDSDSIDVPEEGNTSNDDGTAEGIAASDEDNSITAEDPSINDDDSTSAGDTVPEDDSTSSQEDESALVEDNTLEESESSVDSRAENGPESASSEEPEQVDNNGGISTFAVSGDTGVDSNKYQTGSNNWETYNFDLVRGIDTSENITINVFDYDTEAINNVQPEFQFSESPDTEGSGWKDINAYHPAGVMTGIVKSQLVDGYPVLQSGTSLAYLFNDKDASSSDGAVNGKHNRLNANNLFQMDDDGYYYYDSSKNFATLALNNDPDDNDFWLYRVSNSGDASKPQFLPFNSLDMKGIKKGFWPIELWTKEQVIAEPSTNYHFGMTVEFSFLMPENGELEDGTPMTFEFTGDDDVWVFIDDSLVLDLGGIHGAQTGTINFATGAVTGQSQTISQLVEGWDDTPYQTHTLKFFYLERGGGGSNCKIKFNMPTVPKNAVTVTKRVTGDASDAPDSFQMKFVPTNYDWEQIAALDEPLLVGTSKETATPMSNDGTFSVEAGKSTYIYNVPADMKYQIQELGLTTEGVTVSFTGAEAAAPVEQTAISPEYPAGNRSVVVTNNYPMKPVTPEHRKYVEKNGNGSYDLTLDVTGQVDMAQGETQKIDILYVLDVSRSMSWGMDGSWSDSRLTVAKNAINTLETKLKELAEPSAEGQPARLDIYHSMVTFSSSASVPGGCGWCPISTALSMPSSANGGTNYDDALNKAIDQMGNRQSDRQDAIPVVIFISDGDPDPSENDGIDEIKNLHLGEDGRFFAIGVGTNINDDNLRNLIDNIPDITNENQKGYTVATDSQTLVQKFAELAADIVSVDCSNVTISDTLSQYAKLTSDATFTVTVNSGNSINVSVTPSTFTLAEAKRGAQGTIAYSDGNQSKSVPFTVTYTEEGTPSFALNFDDSYKLENGWTYSITTQVEPTSAAYDYYRNKNGEYPDIGEENTDAPDANTMISTQQPGFYSNNSAVLTYSSAGQDNLTVTYNKPVIQVSTTSLTVTKVFKNADGSPMDSKQVTELGLLSSTKFTVKDEKGKAVATDQTLTSNGGGYSLTVNNLYIGGTYTIVETSSLDGYTVTTSATPAQIADASIGEIKLQKDADGNVVTFENTYTPNDHVLTVIKTVDGKMGDTTDSTKFTFELKLYDEHDQLVTNVGDLKATVAGVEKNLEPDNGKYTFELSHTQQAAITIPAKYTATVEETYDGGYSTYYKISNTETATVEALTIDDEAVDNGKDKWVDEKGYTIGKIAADIAMAKDQTVNFVNYRGIVAPTGLEDNHTKPFGLMVGVAVMAGLALAGGAVVRRRRRWME